MEEPKRCPFYGGTPIATESSPINEKRNKQSYLFGRTGYSFYTLNNVLNKKYELKDTLCVPVEDKVIAFIVEHINKTDEYDDVYFVSRDIVGESSIDDMGKYLDDFTDKMPKELVDSMKIIEHITNVDGKDFKFKRKVNLLSYANLASSDYHSGKDDILFDGLRTGAERCKNGKDGGTRWYWTCSTSLGGTTTFMYVGSNGILHPCVADGVMGVVPCFCLRVYNNYNKENARDVTAVENNTTDGERAATVDEAISLLIKSRPETYELKD